MAPRGPHNPAITWTPHIQLSWGGVLGVGTGEIWTNGVRFVPAGAVDPTSAQLDTMLEGVAGAVEAWILLNSAAPAGNAFLSSDVYINWVKANWILDTGLQRDSNTHVLDIGTPAHGLNGAVPFYQTYALTFRTALKRGRCHSGRIYPPCVNPSLSPGSGKTAATFASQMAQAGANLINDLNTNVSAVLVGTCAVLSPGNTTKGQVPLRQNIISVECDTVPDVQHRRTNRLARQIGNVYAVPPAV